MDAPLSIEKLMSLTYSDLLAIAIEIGVHDNGLIDREDLVERISLMQRKTQKNSYNPFDKFRQVQADINAKYGSLQEILNELPSVFGKIPTKPLSDVLFKGRLLKTHDLLSDLQVRSKALEERQPLIIVAGETNGGKSSFLNLILKKNILPTDVIHCTFAICKIKYSKTYSIETLDHNDERNFYSFVGLEDTRGRLKELVAQEDINSREKGSAYKEITLNMPSPILESGVILVDTPGIGETDTMDEVTMNYIQSTRASAFIYVIKSDNAGGVQEDRLISFLRAILEYKQGSVDGSIDPGAALFICNRWDEISEEGVEKVKKNALTRLEYVWSGFQREQVHFFSSLKAQLHLDADPEFVTSKLNDLMLGLKKLFDRAAHNNIRHHYSWAKHFLQPISCHLSSMINHCIRTNEDLEKDFRSVAAKQEKLKSDSKENTLKLLDTLTVHRETLKMELIKILTEVQPSNLEDYDQLISLCSADKFLHDRKNQPLVNKWIIISLIRYCDMAIQESGIFQDMKSDIQKKIKEHFGLFEENINEIKELVIGDQEMKKPETCSETQKLGVSSHSFSSLHSSLSSDSEMYGLTCMDQESMHRAADRFMNKNMKKGKLKSLPNVKNKILSVILSGVLNTSGKNDKNPSLYIDSCIKTIATLMKDDKEIIEDLIKGYIHIIDSYVKWATDLIPHFTEVNDELMETIRENRRAFRDYKLDMRAVMEKLEPYREQLRGYGLLYMEDANADLVEFNSERRISNAIVIPPQLGVSIQKRDSGFVGSGSKRDRVRGFWVHLRNAVLTIDDERVNVTVKTYSCQLDKSLLLREIASLRCLEHENLAQFNGMIRITINDDDKVTENMNVSPEKISAFIFKGTLISARMFKNNRLIVMKEFMRSFLLGLLSGLEFIHRENLVHLELNLDTVMVDSEGVVKLCQQCMPREIELPDDLSITTNNSICLSPSVLQGDKYDICDDIYAFGLLLWELLFPDNLPYAEQRKWHLKDFVEKVCPSQMLSPVLNNLQASETVLKVLKGCLIIGRGRICMAMADIKRFMKELHEEAVNLAHNQHRRLPVKKQRGGRRESEDLGNTVDKQGIQDSPDCCVKTTKLSISEHDFKDSLPKRPPRKKDAFRKLNYVDSPHLDKKLKQSKSANDLREYMTSSVSKVESQVLSYDEHAMEKITSFNEHNKNKMNKTENRSRKLSVPNIMITEPFPAFKEKKGKGNNILISETNVHIDDLPWPEGITGTDFDETDNINKLLKQHRIKKQSIIDKSDVEVTDVCKNRCSSDSEQPKKNPLMDPGKKRRKGIFKFLKKLKNGRNYSENKDANKSDTLNVNQYIAGEEESPQYHNTVRRKSWSVESSHIAQDNLSNLRGRSPTFGSCGSNFLSPLDESRQSLLSSTESVSSACSWSSNRLKNEYYIVHCQKLRKNHSGSGQSLSSCDNVLVSKGKTSTHSSVKSSSSNSSEFDEGTVSKTVTRTTQSPLLPKQSLIGSNNNLPTTGASLLDNSSSKDTSLLGNEFSSIIALPPDNLSYNGALPFNGGSSLTSLLSRNGLSSKDSSFLGTLPQTIEDFPQESGLPFDNLSTASALPNYNGLSSNTFCSVDAYNSIKNADEDWPMDALPSFDINKMQNNSIENTTNEHMASTPVLSDNMPVLCFNDMHFMNNSTESTLDRSLSGFFE